MTLMERRRALMAQAKAGGKSDMNGWTSGVIYTELEVVNNQYVTGDTGSFKPYNGWSRTGYVPCKGASTIVFPPMRQYSGTTDWNCLYDDSHNPISGFVLSASTRTTITLPANAAFFAISSHTNTLLSCINEGITPYA